jgi:fatty acid-binding protein DegV
MLDVAEERLNGKRMIEVAVADVDSPAEGDDIAQQVKERFGVSTVYRSTVSPVVGSHAGPGTVCITFYT